jgi:hypothetical protein
MSRLAPAHEAQNHEETEVLIAVGVPTPIGELSY